LSGRLIPPTVFQIPALPARASGHAYGYQLRYPTAIRPPAPAPMFPLPALLRIQDADMLKKSPSAELIENFMAALLSFKRSRKRPKGHKGRKRSGERKRLFALLTLPASSFRFHLHPYLFKLSLTVLANHASTFFLQAEESYARSEMFLTLTDIICNTYP